MIRTLLNVSHDNVSVIVAVHAETIQQAVKLAEDRYPGTCIKVAFPLDTETFFVKGSGAKVGLIEFGFQEIYQGDHQD